VSRLRLSLMIAVAAGLAAARWWEPNDAASASTGVELVAAVDRRAAPTLVQEVVVAPPVASGIDVPGNAFAVRVPPAPPVPPPPPPLPPVKLFVGPPEPPPYVPPPPPPPPPVQVIGTWNDGSSPAVFIASPQGGTLLARVGTIFLADYRVSAVTAQHVTFTHTSSKHEWRLPIPSAGSRP
jgi:hypothetical protein